ncbi:MAG TPA: hypothetical protein DEP69_02665 [Acidimicrobiaceae bacterium]|nr:hypothetical protein [Acidimicrobiaceae bacterium]
MLIWFVATALAAMWFTFRDPAIDHRMIVLGALAPDAVDLVVSVFRPGGTAAAAGALHTLAAPVTLLAAVMLATVGRRHTRRRWLMLPIGIFWHLVFDGAWASPALFGWPFGGTVDDSAGGGALYAAALPTAQRSLTLNLVLELAGVVVLAWLWRRWGLSDARRRAVFRRSGRLDPDLPALARGRSR